MLYSNSNNPSKESLWAYWWNDSWQARRASWLVMSFHHGHWLLWGIQDSFLSLGFSICILGEGINSLHLYIVLGLSIWTPHPFPQPKGGACGPRQANHTLVSRALNLGWRNLLELIHCNSSMQVKPSVLSTRTPKASSVSVFHQTLFCTHPVDSLSYWICFQ